MKCHSRFLVNIPYFKRGILRRLGFFVPDSFYVKKMYEYTMGYSFDLKHPQTFNEKLQWLKVYDRKPEYTTMVDKVAVKDYVSRKIGSEYIIPTIGVWDRPSDIPWDELPKSFVLKASQGGGGSGVVLVEDKCNLSKEKTIKLLERAQKNNIYKNLREWPYKNVPNRILAEKLLKDDSGDLKDYKFFCFNGRCEFFKVDFGRFVEHHANYYDRKANLLPFGEAHFPPVRDYPVVMPVMLDQMIILAEKLAEGIPFLRVDLYDCGGKVYFGETTFFPASGMGEFTNPGIDLEIGRKLLLPFEHD